MIRVILGENTNEMTRLMDQAKKDGWKTVLVTLANNIKRPLFKAGKRGYTKKIEYIKGGPKK